MSTGKKFFNKQIQYTATEKQEAYNKAKLIYGSLTKTQRKNIWSDYYKRPAQPVYFIASKLLTEQYKIDTVDLKRVRENPREVFTIMRTSKLAETITEKNIDDIIVLSGHKYDKKLSILQNFEAKNILISPKKAREMLINDEITYDIFVEIIKTYKGSKENQYQNGKI